jgi:hypothetical protein
MDNKTNSTTGQGGFNMTFTRSHDPIKAVQKYMQRQGEPPRYIKPLCGGKYIQLCADEQEGGE